MAESKSQQGDETKRKFREALDRKRAKSVGASDHKDGGDRQARDARSGGEPSRIPPQERVRRSKTVAK